jgi:uncharacterized protein YdeI (YjbR/CyaY-like superfamily)
MDGKNIVIIQGFKEYCALGFFQGALELPRVSRAIWTAPREEACTL